MIISSFASSINFLIFKGIIYFSRHGYLHPYKIEDIIDETTYSVFIEWFKKRALAINTEFLII